MYLKISFVHLKWCKTVLYSFPNIFNNIPPQGNIWWNFMVDPCSSISFPYWAIYTYLSLQWSRSYKDTDSTSAHVSSGNCDTHAPPIPEPWTSGMAKRDIQRSLGCQYCPSEKCQPTEPLCRNHWIWVAICVALLLLPDHWKHHW